LSAATNILAGRVAEPALSKHLARGNCYRSCCVTLSPTSAGFLTRERAKGSVAEHPSGFQKLAGERRSFAGRGSTCDWGRVL
jgi:hypothetical protein